jgi:hypothetical protein
MFCCLGSKARHVTSPQGVRPPKLTPTQQAALATVIAVNLQPLRRHLQRLLHRPTAQKPGLSLSKAVFISAHLDEGKWKAWCTTTWPQMVRRTKERQALLLFVAMNTTWKVLALKEANGEEPQQRV